MTYRITGLDPATLPPDALARAMRVVADCKPGYPCRVTLEDAEPGETMLLLNHVSHDVPGPFRSAYAIYVRHGAEARPIYEDVPPPFLAHRTLGLRGFDAAGLLHDARIAGPGEADAVIRALFADDAVRQVHVHNAGAGCFLARVERTDG